MEECAFASIEHKAAITRLTISGYLAAIGVHTAGRMQGAPIQFLAHWLRFLSGSTADVDLRHTALVPESVFIYLPMTSRDRHPAFIVWRFAERSRHADWHGSPWSRRRKAV